MNHRSTNSSVQRWKRFAEAAALQMSEADVEGIAAALDRIDAAKRPALDLDLEFTEPVTCLRLAEDQA